MQRRKAYTGTAAIYGVGALSACVVVFSVGCGPASPENVAGTPARAPDFVLTKDQTHTKFSRTIEPAVKVPSGSVIEVFTHEATGGQLNPKSTVDDLANVDWDRIHTLTGPVYVEGAEPGDVLAVRLIELEPADWRWMTIEPGFGFLASEFEKPVLQIFTLDTQEGEVEFADGIGIPLKPFAGVMGVAPDPTRC